jgi:hypothetical protein
MGKFTPPASLEEAERRRVDLANEINDINAQLGDRNRTILGERVAEKDYWAWRTKAVNAKRYREAELSLLKLWLKEHRVTESIAAAGAEVDPRDPLSLLRAAAAILCGIEDLTTQGRAVRDGIQFYLHHVAPTPGGAT